MKLVLKDFQEDAVTQLVRHLRAASKDSRTSDRQAVSLSATTGSGKTVMVTRAIELLLQGDDDNPPITDASFLWITDQPELNEQTRKKMLVTSSVLTADDLVVIDASFDRETLLGGAVHFLNIQKLAKDKGLITPGDRRTYTLWETVRNTVDARPGKLFVIVDEAHRGMTEERGAAEATTIIQKFIKGSPGELAPVPIVVGISATPERFNQLIMGTSRTARSVDVDVADVRASGLIKDLIILHHPRREQPTDLTLLREAARALKRCTALWASYCAAHEDHVVLPLLVVQVEDSGGKGRLSETDIPQAIRILRDELGTLPSDALAHSFQERMALELGGAVVRYLAPPDIQDDVDVRVVFFKTSLTLGWDCPRAEVMMSFRPAADSTYIAQLVGRMVRAPLARRITADETLNAVALYLPHYDSAGLNRIISKLTRPDAGMPPIDVEKTEDVVTVRRAQGMDLVFRALEALPSYVVPRARKGSQVRRLMKLARLLTNDELDSSALETARRELLKILNAEYTRKKGSARFKEIVEDRSQIEIEAVNWDVGTLATRAGGIVRVDIASENVDDLFEATGRKLNEGLHKVWWRDRVKKTPSERERAKLELFALGIDPEVISKVEGRAQALVQNWLHAHRGGIAKLDEASRALYDEVRNLAASPELTPLQYPGTIQAREAEAAWPKHVYARDDGLFPAELNRSEAAALQEELDSGAVIAWVRNMDRRQWALCVPFELDGEDRAMYPDFLVVRKDGSDLVVDIVEPHTISLADAPAKAAGMAQFAAQHWHRFGRIEIVLIDGDKSKRLDLTIEAVRNRVKGIKLVEQLRQLFIDT